jgi:hypothetical protein
VLALLAALEHSPFGNRVQQPLELPLLDRS